MGYGLLRYVSALARRPLLGFNHLGRFDAPSDKEWAPQTDFMGVDGWGDRNEPLTHVVELNAVAYHRPDGPELGAHWTWAGHLFSREDVIGLAQLRFEALERLVAYAQTPNADLATPLDLLIPLGHDDIDRIEASRRTQQ